MSKLYDQYLKMKSNKEYSSETLFLFKSGIFFIFIAEDAILASKMLELKLGNLNETIVKCGFPISSLEKYTTLLNKMGYHLKVVNVGENVNSPLTNYVQNQEIQKEIQNILSMNIDNLSISQAYDVLYHLQENFKKLESKR